MPRGDSSQATQRAKVSVGTSSGQLEVNARPLARQLPRTVPGADKLSQLAEALSGLSPALGRLADNEYQENVEAGARERDAAGNNLNALMPEGRGSAFERGWNLMSGKRDALALREKMYADYNNPEVFDPVNGNLEEFIAKYTPPEDKTDPLYQKGFADVFGKARDELRAANFQATQKRKEVEMREGAYSFFLATVQDINRRPDLPAAAKLEALERIRTDFRAVVPGMTNQEMDALLVRAVETEALSGRDAVMDALALRKADGTPGLLENPAYGEKLIRLQAVAAEVRARATAQQREELQFFVLTEAQDQIARGTLTKAWLHKQVKSQILPGERAAALWEKFTETRAKQVTQYAAEAAIRGGDILSLAVVSRSKGGKDAIEAALVKMGEEAQGDPARMANFLETSMKVNLMHPDHEFVLNGASPTNGPSFKYAAELYKNLLLTNPNYVNRFVKDQSAAAYDAYWGGRRAGLTDEESLAVVQRIGDTDVMREAVARIRVDFAKRDGFFRKALNAFENPSNGNEIIDRVRDLTAYRVALGNTTNEAAFQWATERVKQQYQKFDDYWLFNGGRPLSDVDQKALQFYIKSRADQLTADGRTEAEGGLRLYADENTLANGDYLVQFASSGRPLARINIDAARTLYSKYVTDPRLQAAVEFQRKLQSDTSAALNNPFTVIAP